MFLLLVTSRRREAQETAPPKSTFPFKIPPRTWSGRSSKNRPPTGWGTPRPGSVRGLGKSEGKGSKYSSLQDGPGELGSWRPGVTGLGPCSPPCAKKTKYKLLPRPPALSPRQSPGRCPAIDAAVPDETIQKGTWLKSLPNHRVEESGMDSYLSVGIYQSWHSDQARGSGDPRRWKK